jgi:hypothetical protein
MGSKRPKFVWLNKAEADREEPAKPDEQSDCAGIVVNRRDRRSGL